MKTSQMKMSTIYPLAIALFCACSASVKQQGGIPAPQGFPPLPTIPVDSGTTSTSDCPNLSGNWYIAPSRYAITQVQCGHIKIVADCVAPEQVCQELNQPVHAEMEFTPDNQEHESASTDSNISKLFVRAHFEDSSLFTETRGTWKTGESFSSQTRYIHKSNPCDSTDPEMAKGTFGVETTSADGISMCVAGAEESFPVNQ